MPLENENIQEKEDQRSIQNRNWQDGSGSNNPPPNNGGIPPPNDNPPTKENIPQLNNEQRSRQDSWRNSSEMQQGLLNILPKDSAKQPGSQKEPLNLESLRTEWQDNGKDSDNPLNSPVIGFYKEIQGLTDEELNTKIEKGFELFTTAASVSSTVSDVASGLNTSNKAASKASAVTGSISSGIGALKDGVMAIKHIYDAYKDATSKNGSSKQDKAESALKIVQELISAASGTVSALKSILDLFQQASGGLAAAIPGLGLALNAVNIAVSVYELMKAKTNEAFIKKELEGNPWEGTLASKKKAKDKRKAQDKYIATFDEEIAKMTKKEQDLLKEKAKYEKDPSKAKKLEEVNQKLQNTQSGLALAKKQLASLKDNQALTNLEQVNKDRQTSAGIDIGIELTSLVGNVLSLVPEPNAQIAGVALKAVAGGAVVFKKAGGIIVQKMRDYADKHPDSILNGMVDTTRSSDKESVRKKESARYIMNKIAKADLTDGRSVNAINQYIQAAGMSPNELARIFKEKGADKATEALIKAQG